MLKLFKNLKESWLAIVAIILLLVLQATVDLSLPDYTSKIVNIGIQQGGIENAAPEAIRKSTMEGLLLFSEEDDEILKNYTLISKNNLDAKEYEKYLNKYPLLETEELYVRNSLKDEEQITLSSKMAKPLIIFQNLNQAKEVENQTQGTNTIAEIPESMLEQAAIETVKQEYKAIGINTDNYQNNYILMAGLQMLGVAAISMISGISIMLLSARTAAKLGKTLRDKIFKKILGFSISEFKEFSTASLITRSTNDIQQIQGLISMMFRVVVYAPIMGIGGVIKVWNASNHSMTWLIGAAVGAIIFIVLILFIVAMPRFKKLQELVDKLNLVSREMLTGIPVIRAFHTEQKEEKRFDDANKNLMNTFMFVNNAMNLMMPILMLIMNGISLLTIWVGAQNVNNGLMQVGDIMAFLQYTIQIVMSFLMISIISIILPRAGVSAKRINEVLEKQNSIQEPKEPKHLDNNKKGLVEFKNVTFKYPDANEPLLSGINFTAEPGKTTAIIGSTGSGKSTVINLIPRFYDVTAGEVLIDGVNVKDVTQKELREVIGFVPQKGVLFSGTIESNIKYSNENLSDEKMKLAAEIAQATEFIEQTTNKYESEIAQGGSNVSGGQKQRLSIARAIAKDPEIFVFDDSFSALDYKTDAKLRLALSEKTKDKTVIIVAQRINTVLNADQIIVLDDGKIVGKGTHKELMDNCEVYKEIALSQLSKEELE